jgi:protein O-GlcNAc transferase
MEHSSRLNPAQQADVRARFAAAVRHYEAGRGREAFALCQQVLALEPSHSDALQLTGILALQAGNIPVAIEALGRAVARNGNFPDLHNSLGEALRMAGRLDEAIGHYRRAIALAPSFAEAYGNLASALGQQNKGEEAVAAARRAVELMPNAPLLHYNLANSLAQQGQVEEAMASFRRALALAPQFAEAHNNLGSAHQGREEWLEAEACYRRALALRPDFAAAHRNLGLLLREKGALGPAVESLRRAVALAPQSAAMHSDLGSALRAAGRLPEAITAYDDALKLDPDFAEGLANRGEALRQIGRYEDATADFARLLAVDPDHDYALGAWLHAKLVCCDWGEYLASCEKIAAAVADGKRAMEPFAFLLISDSPEQQQKCAQTFAGYKIGEPRGVMPSAAPSHHHRVRHDRIRIAYISADFRNHPVAHLLAGVFEAHDKSRFETVAVSLGFTAEDEMRTRLRSAFDRFIEVQAQSDRDVAQLMRELEIDIAIDLNGYTQGARPGILARRPAPIVVNYLGFCATLGAGHADYILADRTVIPPEQQPFYAEQIVYLPDCFLPHDAGRQIADTTPSRRETGLPESGFVFCSFNNNVKINPQIFDVWMRLLARVEGSVLWLRQDSDAVIGNLRREAQARGVDPGRIVFAPRVPSMADHLARHRRAGLFLDTLPFNAHTTASDALWAGLPVLTCRGASFASRVAASLLVGLGLPELIVDTLDDYEALASRLARDETALAAIRAKLAQSRATSPVFDTGRICRHLESAYATMWARHERGEPPESFAVAPLDLTN